jgi:hypothetical protein
MNFVWWEKTVEYLFVQKYVDIKMIIAPLGGLQEKGGDAIFSGDEKWVLIEFKRAYDCIESEKDKFDDYDDAKAVLIHDDSHHFLIYGELDSEELELKCQTYFSESPIGIEEVLVSGIDEKPFRVYLDQFISLKKSKKGSSGGGYSCVAGVSSDGKVTKVLRLSDFDHGLKLKLEYDIKQKIKKANERNRSSNHGMNGP